MKKVNLLSIVIATLIALAVVLLTSSKPVSDKLARPNEVEGFKIFILCTPVDDYEKLGYIKVGMTWSGKPDQLMNKILKKAKNDYPTGDAILINGIDLEQAMVIKFK